MFRDGESVYLKVPSRFGYAEQTGVVKKFDDRFFFFKKMDFGSEVGIEISEGEEEFFSKLEYICD